MAKKSVVRQQKGTVDERWQNFHARIEGMNYNRFCAHPIIQRAIAVAIKYPFWTHICNEYPEMVPVIQKHFRESPKFPLRHLSRVGGMKINKSTEQYLYQWCLLRKQIGAETGLFNVLEIGGGFGGFSRVCRVMQSFSSWTLMDAKPMLDLAKWYLDDLETEFIETGTEPERRYHLCVSNYCLSETPVEFQEWVFEKVFPKCRRVFLIDGDPHSDYPKRLRACLRRGYRVSGWAPYRALAHQQQYEFYAEGRCDD